MTDWIVPGIIAGIVLYGLCRSVDVYAAMLEGVRSGLQVCMGIFPALLVMLTALAMLRASGAVDGLSRLLSPVLAPLGIPAECLPLALLRPFSGSGALSVGSEVIKNAGPDSLTGRIAAVMLGSSETSFYTIAVYSAYLKLRNTRYALPAALCADAAAFLMAGIAVRLLL